MARALPSVDASTASPEDTALFHPTLSPADAWASVGRMVVDIGKEVEAHAAWRRTHTLASAHLRLEREQRRRASRAAYARFWDGLRALLPPSLAQDLDGWGFSVPAHMKHGQWDAMGGKGRCTWAMQAAASPQGLAAFAARLLAAGHLASLPETAEPGPFPSTFHRVAFDRYALVKDPSRFSKPHSDSVLLPPVYHAATPRMAVVAAILTGRYNPSLGLRRDPVATFHEHFSSILAFAQASAVLSAPGMLSDIHHHPLAKALRRVPQPPGLSGRTVLGRKAPLSVPKLPFGQVSDVWGVQGQPDLSSLHRSLEGEAGAQGRRAAAWRRAFAHFDAQIAAIKAFFDGVPIPPAGRRALQDWRLDLATPRATSPSYAWSLSDGGVSPKGVERLLVGIAYVGVESPVRAWSAESAAALAILQACSILHPLAYGLTAEALLGLPQRFRPLTEGTPGWT